MLRSRRSRPEPFALGVAGTDHLAVVHTLAARAAGVTVAAIAGDDAIAVGRLAADAGARAATLEDLADGVDAVVIATPVASRLPLALRALDAGVDVLVEAPMSTTLAEADQLVAAESAGATMRYGENLLVAPAVLAAAPLVRDMGELRFVEARSLSPRPTDGSGTPSGGVLFELGVHPIALVLLLAGSQPLTSVRAMLAKSPDLELDDHAEVEMRFASGLVARVEASWRHPEPVWDLQASSDSGVVRVDLLPTVGLEHDGEAVSLPAVPSDIEPHLVQLGYVDQLRALAGVATPPAGPQPGAAFGRAVLEVVCASYSSSASGKAVALPFAGPRDVAPLALWRS
ncbi:MAG TPA: Gfo/Idh/MocA family oxidoreductase [Acidimicrobiales bacterium]